MSHELRTPLNAIQGHVQLLEMGVHGALTDVQREALARVQRSQHHLLSLINDVLNFAKLEAGRIEYDLRPIELAPVVRDVVETMHPQLDAKKLTVSVRVSDDIVVRADADKVHQILLNLVTNAAKFTERGGVTIDVAAREVADGALDGTVFIRVSDTGIGVPRDKLETIFDPFVQAHRNLKRSDPGTGLGLAISRDLARGMGGDLRVRSAEGRGSVFTLSLPRA
jgi:signal transduction histidine kinase